MAAHITEIGGDYAIDRPGIECPGNTEPKYEWNVGDGSGGAAWDPGKLHTQDPFKLKGNHFVVQDEHTKNIVLDIRSAQSLPGS